LNAPDVALKAPAGEGTRAPERDQRREPGGHVPRRRAVRMIMIYLEESLATQDAGADGHWLFDGDGFRPDVPW
jgi:hypothetical protein